MSEEPKQDDPVVEEEVENKPVGEDPFEDVTEEAPENQE